MVLKVTHEYTQGRHHTSALAAIELLLLQTFARSISELTLESDLIFVKRKGVVELLLVQPIIKTILGYIQVWK
ncbi:unnamed protein product [Larinioides sclopetarius]|uniref:Uncharacterized protein n=1 Tax=Larinioides sclopetarius TaxID=280406 RepID=A0AAV2B0R0_9ARAC